MVQVKNQVFCDYGGHDDYDSIKQQLAEARRQLSGCDSHNLELIESEKQLKQENARLTAQLGGAQALADEKCRCFLERAEKAEAQLAEAQKDLPTITLSSDESLSALKHMLRQTESRLDRAEALLKRTDTVLEAAHMCATVSAATGKCDGCCISTNREEIAEYFREKEQAR